MIGLLPAAGTATRMNGLPKWMLPVPAGSLHSLLEVHSYRMKLANCANVYIGANEDNYELLCEFNSFAGVYVVRADTHKTMTETVLNLRSHYAPDSLTLFGMPDTYIEDTEAYQKLADALNDGAQVAVGLFRTRPSQRSKLGMCRVDNFKIVEVIDKANPVDLDLAWGVLGWQPAFWDYLKPEDPHVGYAIPRAIAAGLDVRAVMMDGQYFDCGSPEEYFECIRAITA